MVAAAVAPLPGVVVVRQLEVEDHLKVVEPESYDKME